MHATFGRVCRSGRWQVLKKIAIRQSRRSPTESELVMNLKSALFFALFLSAPLAYSQSDASVAASIGGISELTGTALGSLVGAGVGLTVGAVSVVGSAAYLTIATSADAASSATEFTLLIPLGIADKLSQAAGATIEARQDATGTGLFCRDELVAYIPKANASKRETL
jgi:hypothetical protein